MSALSLGHNIAAARASAQQRSGDSRRRSLFLLLDTRYFIPSLLVCLLLCLWQMEGKKFSDILRGEPSNARMKYTPDGKPLQLMVFNRNIFTNGLESTEHKKKFSVSRGYADDTDKTARRAKSKMVDYILCNPDMDMFVTLTLSQEKIDRSNIDEIVKRLNTYLDNRVRRRGLKYVLVPEFHADGENYHFHGMFNSAACKMVDSGHKTKQGQTIYNLTDWKLGFTTAIRVYGDSRTKVARYVGKYITKQMDGGKIAGRYYYHGGALLLPRCEYFHLDYDGLEMPEIEVADGIKFRTRTYDLHMD